MAILRIVDSITELAAHDTGCIAVSGSHGGLSSARYALAARPLLSVFNDAGVGLNNAGLAALDFLQSHGLAACTVAHHSARIGEAQSTLASGIVSVTNAAASALGVQVGWTCQQTVDLLLNSQESS
jgi:NCAIR mutase (PurE)-related protein